MNNTFSCGNDFSVALRRDGKGIRYSDNSVRIFR